MDIIPEQEPFIQDIQPEWYGGKIGRLSMLRLDVIHQHVSGNKWYKLKLNIKEANRQKKDTILTFGGGYSNHLAATAAMCAEVGLSSVGVVRGVYPEMTPTLQFCKDNGMYLHFVSTEEYKHKNDPEWLTSLSKQFDDPYIVPEGGANKEGRKGAEEIGSLIAEDFTDIVLSVGSGTMLSGVVNSTFRRVVGMAPMKGGHYVAHEVEPYIDDDKKGDYCVFDRWHFGGFGKCPKELIDFMNEFYADTKIPLDMVYTAKMIWGVRELISEGYFPLETKLICIHSGGLQGNMSIREKLIY